MGGVVYAGKTFKMKLQSYHLQTLQHSKLRRKPLQLIEGQIDMGDQ